MVIGQGKVVPVIVITCTTCGNLEMFNALMVKHVQQVAKARSGRGE